MVSAALDGQPGVATVRDSREVLEPLVGALELLRRAAWALAGVLLVCTMLLVSTTIRQIAWSRRRETGIKRIVGASKAAIRLPFLIETLVAALAGTALAVGALWLLASYGFRALGTGSATSRGSAPPTCWRSRRSWRRSRWASPRSPPGPRWPGTCASEPAQHSMTFTARPPREVSLYLAFMSAPV